MLDDAGLTRLGTNEGEPTAKALPNVPHAIDLSLARPGVYLFAAVGTGLVKIGFTECVLQRLTGGIRGPSGEKLAWIGDMRGGREVERFLHDKFATRRLWKRREWFYLDDEISDLAAQARTDWRMSHRLCLRELTWDETRWRGRSDAAWYFAWHADRTPSRWPINQYRIRTAAAPKEPT